MARYIAAVIAVLVLLLFIQGFRMKALQEERKALRTDVASLQSNLEQTKKTAVVTEKVLTDRAQSQVRIQLVTKEIIRAVPTFIPAGTPDLPGGFRLLHDSAALGVPPPASGPPAAPAPVEDVTRVVAENYATCLDNADQLHQLIQWHQGVTKQ